MIYAYSIFGILFITGWYFAVRYFLLEKALREVNGELQEIGGNLEQNRILRLPFPDRSLGELLASVNAALEAMRRERMTYARREKAFQEQIENISHDLRTPLTVILGYLKMLKKQKAEQEKEIRELRQEERSQELKREKQIREVWQETAEAMEAMERNARILEKLVAQFYTYSQVSAGEYEIALEAVDACRILRESLADNYGILEGLSLKTELPEHPLAVYGNREALERIFLNLLQNAGRYAKSYLTIHMEDRGDGEVRFLFENDGPNMTQEDISHLFDRFYQGDFARNKGGSGLGLAIARALAERMGGSLGGETVESEPREEMRDERSGVCFILALRRA